MNQESNRFVEGMKLMAALADPNYRRALEEDLRELLDECRPGARSVVEVIEELPSNQQLYTMVLIVGLWCEATAAECPPLEVHDAIMGMSKAMLGGAEL